MLDINKIERTSVQDDFKLLYKERNDMQGLVTRGYKSLPAAVYLLLEITKDDVAGAKKYLNCLVNTYLSTAGKDLQAIEKDGDLKEAVNIAFTSSGLKKLKLDDAVYQTFSREFIEGICYSEEPGGSTARSERPVLLGDVGRNDPNLWHWGNKKKPVDCLLLLYAKNSALLEELIRKAFTEIKQGVTLIYRADTYELSPGEEMKEHFGFRDGISQPILKGIRKSGFLEYNEQMLVNAGEVILGHKNEYNNYSPCPFTSHAVPDLPELPGDPDKKNLGMNGTYLVFRQIEQHVEAFWEFMLTHSKESGDDPVEKAIHLGAKMIGRMPDGQPLVNAPQNKGKFDDAALNNFFYAKPWDEAGVQCPLGAHIRRTNPRDQVHTGRGPEDSLEMSKRHRMLRRGRIYGAPLVKNFDIPNLLNALRENKKPADELTGSAAAGTTTPVNRGLHFICLVSDIARQFEFVQNVWANTPTFADLTNEVDPVISPRIINGKLQYDEFTAPKELLRNRYRKVPEFTTVVGGGYFFLPGIRAIRYILS